MNARSIIRMLVFACGVAAAMMPQVLYACAVCYGESDAPMARGMNWGILTLLAVIGTVLASIVSFFVFLGWRSSKLASNEQTQTDI